MLATTKSTFYETTERIFITEMNLFKKEFLTSLKHIATLHSHHHSNDTKKRISLLQHKVELRQE